MSKPITTIKLEDLPVRISKSKLMRLFKFYSTSQLRDHIFTDDWLNKIGMSAERYKWVKLFLPDETVKIKEMLLERKLIC